MHHTKHQSVRLAPTPERLARRFLGEAIAAAVGEESGIFSIAELGDMAMEKRYGDLDDDLSDFFKSLEPYRVWGDFQPLGELPRPRPLALLIDPSILYGHFRAWLRKQGIDPDTITQPEPTLVLE